MMMGCLLGERPFDLCSEGSHLSSGRGCTLLSAASAGEKLDEVEGTLRMLLGEVEGSWRGLTFKRPSTTSTTTANLEANELVKLDVLARKLRLTLKELLSTD